jgi:hypothetical protein
MGVTGLRLLCYPFGGARPFMHFILVLFLFIFKVARYARFLLSTSPE